LRRRNARTSLVVSHKILGFLETPSSLIASYLDPSARLATVVTEELFGVSAREPSQRPDIPGSLQVFVLDIDRRPTLAFEADGLAAAQQICRDPDLRADLAAFTSGGVPVCAPNSMLSARAAAPEEIAAFRHAVQRAPASGQPTMTFLIKIDGIMVVTIGPERD
jgi:hypothetical protein